MKQILVIQTASIGDVILATAVLEKLHASYPEAQIDFLVKKGNQSLFFGHPFIRNILVWDKKKNKIQNLLKLIMVVRETKYDFVVNLQRFLSSGLITALSQAKEKAGFDKNPMSFTFSRKFPHYIGENNGTYMHEIERNQQLIAFKTDNKACKPKLYPSEAAYSKTHEYKNDEYICVAPASLWYTKQYPKEEWCKFLEKMPEKYKIYLLGSTCDIDTCRHIKDHLPKHDITILAGELSLLESAALMKDSKMNYVCDSSPMHLATAVDAPTTAIFCSTVPEFGFGPLASKSFIVQTKEELKCRPCGLHGHRECPKGNFACATSIKHEDLLSILES